MGLPTNAKLFVPYTMKDKYDALIATSADGKIWGSVTADKLSTIENVLYDGSISYLVTEVGVGKVEIVDIIDDGTMLLGTTFTFPSTLGDFEVVSVGGLAMSRLNGITTVVLPDGLEYINFSAIDTPITVSEYVISASNTVYITNNGVIYSKDQKTLIMYPVGKTGSFTLESTTEIIGERAFAGCTLLTEVVINQKVIIANEAFARCISLTNVSFTSTTASIFIGRDIFINCDQLTAIIVPTGCADAYKNMIFYDTDIADKIISAS